MASIRVGVDFKVAVQKNNYISFYDESRQLWSILFDSEDLVVNFGTQVSFFQKNIHQINIITEFNEFERLSYANAIYYKATWTKI